MKKHLCKIPDHIRNLNVLVLASILNFSFAAEKFFLMTGNPLSDKVWFFVYGGLGLILTAIAFWDFNHDVKEGKSTDVERII